MAVGRNRRCIHLQNYGLAAKGANLGGGLQQF
jgi:hypothetical protein